MTEHMPYVFDDGGRADAGFSGDTGDCVVRSVAIATERPYLEVYDALSLGCKSQRKTKRSKVKASARDGVYTSRKWFKDFMAGLGWVFVPTMTIGSGCTVHLVKGELPMGRLIVSVSKHYTAVIDGVVHDTHNPQRRTYHYAPVTSLSNEVVRISERCVYGYWKKAS